MEKEQIQMIAALITGCQTAIITLADHLSRSDVLSKEALATHFDNTAAAIGSDVKNRELIQMVLGQVARGLRSVKDQPIESSEQIQKLFH